MAERWLSSLPPTERVEVIDRTIEELSDLRDAAVREMDDLEYARWRAGRHDEVVT
jgi:hypothetical protein